MSAVSHRELSPPGAACGAGQRDACAGLTLELVSDIAAFEALEQDWNALFRRAGRSHQLFQSFNWNWHWCRHYLAAGPDSKWHAPSIVVGRSGGRVVMLWPLVADRKLGLRQVCFMGSPVTQYADVLVEDAPERLAWLREGWRFVCEALRADVICLPRVRADADLAELLGDQGMQPTAETEAPYADLSGLADFEAYAARLSARARRDRRRKWRRLAEQGAVSVEILRGEPGVRAAVRQAVEFKRHWLRARGLVSKAFADARIEGFFAEAAASPDRPVGCDAVVLKVGREVAAIEIGLVADGRRANHICAYNPDPRLARCAPGALVMEEAVRSCLDRGLTCYDLMGPGDAYKYRWTDRAVALGDYALALTPPGRLYLAVGGNVHAGMRSAFHAMPLGLRQMTAPLASRLG